MASNEPSDSLALADVLQAASDLVALAAIYYVEPFARTSPIFFSSRRIAALISGGSAIYAHLQARGWEVEREHLLVRGFAVQFLAPAA
jgi:hypothetical protein